jgi:ABC-2 type transport system permease protein
MAAATAAPVTRRLGLRSLWELTVLELKLFLREPLTVLFTLALPLVLLYVLGGVFGNTPDPTGQVYRGVGAMSYYVPAYVALVIASLGLIGLPVHLAGYREQGVLRRFRASSMPTWQVIASQLAVTFVLAVVGAAIVVVAGTLTYDIAFADDPWGVAAGFVVGALAFAAIGVLLGAVLPTARAAQAAGVLLWFVMLIIGGAGPPPEVLTSQMRAIADVLPLRPLITAVQDPWLGFGCNVQAVLVVAAFGLVAAALARWLFRWE